MTRIFDELEREVRAVRAHLPHYHHQQDQTTPEAPVTLPIITAIENEARTIGHDISAELHAVLSRHLTVGNMLAHAGQYVAEVQASPVAVALEKFALGPAGEAAAAKIVEDVAGLLQAQGGPVDSTPDPVPAEVPAA